jgi:hypothetical protein
MIQWIMAASWWQLAGIGVVIFAVLCFISYCIGNAINEMGSGDE